jgi:alpha-glucosidase
VGFLGPGQYVAEVYADAPGADEDPRKTTIEEKRVSARSALTLSLAPGGGAAVRLRPAE